MIGVSDHAKRGFVKLWRLWKRGLVFWHEFQEEVIGEKGNIF